MPKKNLKATLIRYARVEGKGWRRGSIITSRNGRVKKDAMRIGSEEHPIDPTSPYQVRYYQGTKACYVTVGSDYEAARAMLEKRIASRQLEAAHEILGIIKPEEPPEKEPSKAVAELVVAYLKKKKAPSLDLSTTAIRHYEAALNGFAALSGRKLISEVTEADVTGYMDSLVRKGYSQKTRTMRYTTVRGFLKNHGADLATIIEPSIHFRLSAKPEADTDPYTQEQLDRLLAKCDEYHKLVFNFLLATGLRYREANHLTWSNIDIIRNVITVPCEQRVNRTYRDRIKRKMVTKAVKFKTKSRRKREVPIFPSLRPLLLQWRQNHPERVFVLGSRRSDMPDNHWLEYGKRAWRKAKLNCGVCDACVERDECEGFFLHKFRHTFAHCCLDAGIGIHKVSRWLGHHSIEVTAVYLSGRPSATEKDPFASPAAVEVAA